MENGALAAILAYLKTVLPDLMDSKENWQVVLHGGRNGQVIVEVLTKTVVVDGQGEAAKAGNQSKSYPSRVS